MKKQTKKIVLTSIVLFITIFICGGLFSKNQVIKAKEEMTEETKESSKKAEKSKLEYENEELQPKEIFVNENGTIEENESSNLESFSSSNRVVDPVWGSWGNWQKNYNYSTSVVNAKGISSLGSNKYRANLHWKVTMLQGDTHTVIPINYGAFGLYANKTTSVTPVAYTATGSSQYFLTSYKKDAATVPKTGVGYAKVKTWYEGTTLMGGPSYYFSPSTEVGADYYYYYSPPTDGIRYTMDLDVNFDYVTTDQNGYTKKNNQTGITYYYPSAPWEPQLIKAKYIDIDTGLEIGQGTEIQGYNGYLFDSFTFVAKDIPNYTYKYRVETDDTGTSTTIADATNKTSTKKMNLNKQGIVFYYKKELKSSISVNKYDAENRTTKLANATIQLYDTNKKLLDTKVTNGVSDIKFENLTLGTYYLKETGAPSGYDIDNKEYVPITLTASGVRYDFYDSKLKNTISVNKYDADNRTTKLANATIQLYDVNKKLLDTKVTNGVSDIKFENLTLGTYYLKETGAPSGYNIDNKEYVQIVLTASGVRYDFYDSKLKSTISVGKYDADNRTTRLSGAVIELYDSNKKAISAKLMNGTTDITFTNLALGTYYLRELEAPEGYEVDNSNYIPITLTASGARYDFYDSKLKSTISVGKYDADNRTTRLSGAVIELYDSNKKAISARLTSGTTDTTFTNLALGTYYLRELEAPEGYEIDNKEYVQITLTASGARYDFYDSKLKSTISVGKYDADNRTTRLSGAVIELYDSNKKAVTARFTSGTEDINFVNLALGTYYLRELEAPEGYEIDNKEYVQITLTASGTSYNFYDSKLKSTISVGKYDAENRTTKLANATIKLYDANKNELANKMTNGVSDIKFENLTLGTYYLKETTAPNGYGIDNQNFVPITLTASGASYNFYDSKLLSKIIVKKVDVEEKSKLLQGAQIILYDKDKNELFSAKTDENGEVIFPNLKEGSYFLKEVQAPDGYKIDNTNFVSVIVKAGEDTVYTFSDTKLDSGVSLNIRQSVLSVNNELVIPTNGYFWAQEMQTDTVNANKSYGLDSISGEENLNKNVTTSDFTNYKLRMATDSRFLNLNTILPEYYNFVGYQVTTNESKIGEDHISTQKMEKPINPLVGNSLSTILLDYNEETTYYVTVYIQPNRYLKFDDEKNSSPKYYNWDYKTNKFNYIK